MNRLAPRFAYLCLLTLTCLGGAAMAQTCREIEVRNVRPNQGAVMLSAFTSAADFEAKQSAMASTARAGSADTLRMQFCGTPGSSVSLLVMQDLNGNGKLDRNVLGMPTEPWGASAGPTGAPTWDTTQVPLAGELPLVVQLSQ